MPRHHFEDPLWERRIEERKRLEAERWAGLTEKQRAREWRRRKGFQKLSNFFLGAMAVVVLVTLLLLALVGASGASAQPADRVERKFDALLALAQQAASADGTPAGADIFAAQAECRTAYELELERLRRAGPPDYDYIAADDGSGPKSTVTPPPHSPVSGGTTVRLLPRRDPAYFQLERIANCLRALSWTFGALQLRLESQLQQIRRDIAELKRP